MITHISTYLHLTLEIYEENEIFKESSEAYVKRENH